MLTNVVYGLFTYLTALKYVRFTYVRYGYSVLLARIADEILLAHTTAICVLIMDIIQIVSLSLSRQLSLLAYLLI